MKGDGGPVSIRHGRLIYANKICMYDIFMCLRGTELSKMDRYMYLEMALDMRYADSLDAHEVKNSLGCCFW